MITEKGEFGYRLAMLRMAKGVSARDMSLSIGQSGGYINNIENGGNFPSMQGFFYICEYLDITPEEFFDTGTKHPGKIHDLISAVRGLGDKQLDNLIELANDISGKHQKGWGA